MNRRNGPARSFRVKDKTKKRRGGRLEKGKMDVKKEKKKKKTHEIATHD